MKKCPFCAEDIQDAAIKCRYCGEMVEGISSEQVQQWTDEINAHLAAGQKDAALQKTQVLLQKLKAAPNQADLLPEIRQAESALATLSASVVGEQTKAQANQQQAGCLGSVAMFLLLYGGNQVWTVHEARETLRNTGLGDGGVMYSNIQNSGFFYLGIGFLVLLLAAFAGGNQQKPQAPAKSPNTPARESQL